MEEKWKNGYDQWDLPAFEACETELAPLRPLLWGPCFAWQSISNQPLFCHDSKERCTQAENQTGVPEAIDNEQIVCRGRYKRLVRWDCGNEGGIVELFMDDDAQ